MLSSDKSNQHFAEDFHDKASLKTYNFSAKKDRKTVNIEDKKENKYITKKQGKSLHMNQEAEVVKDV